MPPKALLRSCRFALRLAFALLVLIAVLFCGFRVYTVYLTHRAVLLLDDATRIQIGANEDSVLPFVARCGFLKQLPSPPEPADGCPVTTSGLCVDGSSPQSREEREYWNAHRPDYTYVVNLSPFNAFSSLLQHQQPRGVHLALTYLMLRTPIFLRNLLSLRDWIVFARVPIRGGRVEGVSSGLYVEGSTHWLGHSWRLVEEIFPAGMPQKTYTAEGGFLELNTGGESTEQSITHAATAEQFTAAQSINTGCLTKVLPCSSLYDLSPRAYEYKKLHPESDSNLE